MMKKRVISLFLALLMLIQLAPSAPAAETDHDGTGPAIMEIQIVRSARTAAVRMNAGGRQALLILAMYTEAGQLLETQMTEVTGEADRTETLLFSQGFPQRFQLQAMLVDRVTYAPLCKSCQDFSETVTVDDFDPGLVLNFDEQRDENFAVLTEGVVPLYAERDFSRFETKDGMDFTLYGVPSETAGRLNTDTRIVLLDGGNSYPLEAASVQVSGDTVTLRGKELTEDCIGNFFEYLTVDQTLDSLDGAEFQCEDGIQLAAEDGLKFPYAIGFNVDYELTDTLQAELSLDGTLEIHVNFLYKKDLLGQPYFFYDISVEDTFDLELELTGTLDNAPEDEDEFEIPLLPELRIPFPQAPFVEFVVSLTAPMILELEAGFTWAGTIHSQYRVTGDSKSAPAFTQDTCLENCSFKAEAVFRDDSGIRLRVAIEVLRKLLYIEIAGQAGVEATVALCREALDKVSVDHPCDLCFEGTMIPYLKCWIELGSKLSKVEVIYLKNEFEHQLDKDDFYISLNKGKLTFAWGACPNISYLCRFSTVDADTGTELPANIHVVPLDGGGDSLMGAAGYLHAGRYEATAKYEGYTPAVEEFTVSAPMEITLKLKPCQGNDVNEPVHGTASGTFTNGPAETYRLYPDGYMYGTSPSGTPGMLTKRQNEYSWQLNADTRRSIVHLDLVDGCFDSVGAYAFKDCTNLVRADLDPDITRILPSAFQNCAKLTTINIPGGTQIIGSYAFQGCSSLRSPLRVSSASIAEFAFADCSSLPSATIGGGSIGASAFSNCTGLTSASLADIQEIPNSAFVNCQKLEYVDLPETLTSIGDSAFKGCVSLRELTIPQGVTTLGSNAVWQSGVRSLTIPGNATSMGNFFAYQCPALETVTFQEGLTEIPHSAFRDCPKLVRVDLPNTLKAIGDGAFQGDASLREITIPASVETIGYGAFEGCIVLQSAALSPVLRIIEGQTFYGCRNLREITIPLSVTEIRDYAFDNSGLSDIYYEGTEAQWNTVRIGFKAIDGVTVHFLGER